MRFRFWSSARAAMLGGDGMYHVGPPPQPAWLENPSTAFFARRLGVTFEMLFHSWLCLVLEYDPQKLLPPPTYTCAQCGGVFEKGWSDEEAVAEKDEHWAGLPLDDCAIVCDDCYKGIFDPSLILAREAARLMERVEEAFGRIYDGITPVIPAEVRTLHASIDVGREGPPVVIIHLGDFEGVVPGMTSLIVDESIDYRCERRMRDWPLHMKVEPLRRDPSYLQHDPTKNVRRRRRK